MKKNFIIQENDSERRLDKIIRKLYPRIPLSLIFKAFRKGWIKINGKKAKPEQIANAKDELKIYLPIQNEETETVLSVSKTREIQRPQGILYENQHILAINKPKGKKTHGPDSLLEEIMPYLEAHSKNSISWKPGPVNRLDQYTSGCLFYSLSLKGATELSRIIKERQCRKYYLALMEGKLKDDLWEDYIERDKKNKITKKSNSISGKKAVTQVWPLLYQNNKSLVLCRIETGLTHQIRVQAKIQGHPLTGDKKYNLHARKSGMVLHSYAFQLTEENNLLGFQEITAPLPANSLVILKNHWEKNSLEKALKKAETIYRSGA